MAIKPGDTTVSEPQKSCPPGNSREAVGRAHQRLGFTSSGRCVDLWYTHGILISYIYIYTNTPTHDLKYIHIHMYVYIYKYRNCWQ